MTAMMPDSMASIADPVPSEAEVMCQLAAEAVNKNLPASRVADYRNPHTAVPRTVPERDYMHVPSLRDMGLR